MSSEQRAGNRIYQDILRQYRTGSEGEQRSMNELACKFADSQKPEDRFSYLAAKARHGVWEQAIYTLTQHGGDLMRLDIPK